MGARTTTRACRWAVAGLLSITPWCTAPPVQAAPQPVPAQNDPLTLASSTVLDATEPSITDDGRWVVFGGTVDGRRSVFRTDRETGTTVELSPVPSSARSGHTVHGRISADGCVVVAITEIAFDLFRDDDTDARWDVYRLVVPECNGQPNAWELVSTADRSGTARDDVFTDSAPTLSGSGALIAFAHPLTGAPEGVGTITVVDVTVPINEPGRLRTVAGMPPELPGRAFRYRGARQPALSHNGRHLAFVSDATASAALPGWAEGTVAGGYATSQVYVWDRQAGDARGAVRLISGRDGVPSRGGGYSPAISEDGRIVVFTSPDRNLVTAELPRCRPACETQIYRYDRDTDGNGILDELPRRDPLTIVSAVDAGSVDVGVPVAGNRSSWAPAVNADGSQVAFVTDATNLMPSYRAGGGTPRDGDLLVAEIHLGELRRVLDGPEVATVPGTHGNPDLSKTGQTIAFETSAAGVLGATDPNAAPGNRSIVTVDVSPQLSLAALDFGSTTLALESGELIAGVLNSGPAAFEPTSVASSSSNFRITGGTCTRGVIVAAGTSCSVRLTFTPTAPRGYAATLTVSGDGEDAPSVSAELFGAAGDPALLTLPGGVDLDPGVVGRTGGRVAIDVLNVGFLPIEVARIHLGGAHPDDFTVVSQSCTNRALNPEASCTVEVQFTPTGGGYRSALLRVTATTGQYTSAVLGSYARYEPEIDTELESAQPGTEFGFGGNGFPANSTVTIGFGDGEAPFATVETNEVGAFLARLTMPGRLRIGDRVLVASAPGGAVASTTVEILPRASRSVILLPGYGMG